MVTVQVDKVVTYSSRRQFENAQVSDVNRDRYNEPWRKNAITEYVMLCRNGWPEGMRRVKDFTKKLRLKLKEPYQKRGTHIYDSVGDEYDIHRVYAGSMEPWQRRKKVKLQRAPINIYINVDHNAIVGPEAKFWPAAAGLILSNYFIDRGHPVRIVGLLSVTLDGGNYSFWAENYTVHECEFEIVLKDFLYPFNLQNLALVGHEMFQRYHGFKAFCSTELKVKRGYGAARRIETTKSQTKSFVFCSFILGIKML